MKRLKALIATVTLMKPKEQRAAYAAFTMVFVLMAVYFILRPVRDAMASDWSDAEVSLLGNIPFFLCACFVMLCCWVINRMPFRWVVPWVYGLFALSFLAFYLITSNLPETQWVEQGFYLWVTAFSLLNLSVFWSFMSETFSAAQGKRLFAFIAAGASAGALVGPAIPTLFADALGLSKLMLVAASGLLLVIPIIIYLIKTPAAARHAANKDAESSNDDAIQGKHRDPLMMQAQWWSGFKDTVKNPYLLGIAAFIVLYVFISSFVYFQQKNLLAEFSRADRAQILGGIDWLVNVLTFVFAFVLTSRMVRRLGMGITLACLPLMMVLGFAVLAIAPAVLVLLAIHTARRVGNYAITRPAREMLFTQVTADERFKAKPVIDVVVYRGGDAVSGSMFALLSEGVGLGIMGMSVIGAGVAACWATCGLYLGKRFERLQTAPGSSSAKDQNRLQPSLQPPLQQTINRRPS